MIDFLTTHKRIATVLGIIIFALVAWVVVRAFQSPTLAGGSINLFKNDFISSISRQVTKGLATGVTSPATVTLEELGEISPLAGMVTIDKDVFTIRDHTQQTEYVVLHASLRNAQPINISNWSLQSMVSDTWISMPQGTEQYAAGVVNELEDIYLKPGDTAIIATAESPIGVSFRVNECSGFLSSTQKFSPSLRTSCVNPAALFPPTIENIRTYGDACIALAESTPACTYVSTSALQNTTQACKEELQTLLTYNSCVALRFADKDFSRAREWRIFLNQPHRLWKDSYEVIRLLDDQHRTVDVFTY